MSGSTLRRPRTDSPRWPAAAALRREVARRNALAFRPQPEGVTTPRWRLLAGELASAYESWRDWRRMPAVALAARTPRTVMLLPGFGTHPVRMRKLRASLSAAGHHVGDWGLGWNLGATEQRLDDLVRRIEADAHSAGEPLVLIGWSLGGLFAREAAKRTPHAVRMVVTMGTPFSGNLHANNAWRAYHWVTGQDVAAPPVPGDYAAKPPVPTYALWSPRDGIVAPRAARGRPGQRDAAVALRCTHLGFASHPSVLAALSALLDADQDAAVAETWRRDVRSPGNA